MEIAVNLLVVLEMVGVNLSVMHTCGTRKYSGRRIAAVFLLFTAGLVGGSYVLLSRGSQFGNGNGLFSVLGFLYLIPIRLLYRESLPRILSIMCSSWIYTMLIFVFSVHFSSLFSEAGFALRVLLVQTGLYAGTVWFFFRWVKGGLLFLLHHMNGGLDKILLAVSVGWYAAAILLNLTFLYPKALILRLVTLCVLIGIAAMSYLLIYRLVKSCRNETQLQEIAYTDHLTGLRNRAGLFLDANTLMEKKTPFSLVFMDLNRFKSINDSYGHLAGDRYLCWFSKHVQELLDSQGRLYRMSGDEFVCLYTGRETPEFVKNIRLLPRVIQEEKIPFWGCSVGVSCYPEDSCSLDRLIYLADQKMYGEKREHPPKA